MNIHYVGCTNASFLTCSYHPWHDYSAIIRSVDTLNCVLTNI